MLARISAVVALLALAAPQAPAGGSGSSAQPQSLTVQPTTQTNARSERNASYRIIATLDPARKTITGSETLTWRNITSTPAPTLQFHLYYNAWRNDQSSWMREAILDGLDAESLLTPDRQSWIDVKSLHVIKGGTRTDLTGQMTFIAPDDGNRQDRTVMAVPLPSPVSAGETIDVELSWTSKVPRTIARTGYVGNFFFVAQWFPKIGVFEDRGWNCHQFHATTEFFADFGTYDVELTVPRGWIVGATGHERSTRDGAQGTTHRYYQEDVHDFAWTTSPDYIERRARFEHPTLPPVQMRLLLQPEHAAQAERHFEATRATLKYYGEWFGPYPYDQDPGRPGWTPLVPNDRWADPDDERVPELRRV